MKNLYLKAIKCILRQLAKAVLWRHKPGIIAITGGAGKTSTREAIKTVLSSDRRVRASSGNFNNEIGVPLTILGGWQKIVGGPFFWLWVFLSSFFRAVFKTRYPEILILEYAVDRPGDMKYLLEIVRPQIAVVAAIGEIPVHVEFFSGPEGVAKEKGRLVEQLPSLGFAILNADDDAVYNMKDKTRAHVITYGFGDNAEMKISNFENRSESGRTWGISFKLEYGGSFVPVRLDNVFGKGQAYAAAAAACVGVIFGFNLVRISEALLNYKVVKGRLNLIPGIKNTYVLNDSYNASFLSMHNALDTLKDLKAERKVAVLGDMLEIGKYTPEAHQSIGRMAAKIADILVTVGPRAKLIAEGAKEAGFSKENILSFDTADEARLPVQDLIKEGDLVLIKASRAIGLDKVVEEIKAVIV